MLFETEAEMLTFLTTEFLETAKKEWEVAHSVSYRWNKLLLHLLHSYGCPAGLDLSAFAFLLEEKERGPFPTWSEAEARRAADLDEWTRQERTRLEGLDHYKKDYVKRICQELRNKARTAANRALALAKKTYEEEIARISSSGKEFEELATVEFATRFEKDLEQRRSNRITDRIEYEEKAWKSIKWEANETCNKERDHGVRDDDRSYD